MQSAAVKAIEAETVLAELFRLELDQFSHCIFSSSSGFYWWHLRLMISPGTNFSRRRWKRHMRLAES